MEQGQGALHPQRALAQNTANNMPNQSESKQTVKTGKPPLPALEKELLAGNTGKDPASLNFCARPWQLGKVNIIIRR